jgi:tetratricopeptide (TPR) repeat protein
VRIQPTGEGDAASAPLEPAEVARALEQAADREQAFALLLRAACSRVPFAALLSVHREGFRGRRAIARERFDGSGVGELHIARNVVPAFEQAVTTRSFHIGAIATGVPAIDEQLRRLGGVVPRVALIVPVVLNQRTVALLIGHSGDHPVALDAVSDLFPLVSQTERVLQRILSLRAQAAAEKPSPPLATPATVQALVPEDIDEVEAQRRVLAVCREYESWAELADTLRALLRIGLERGEPDEDEQLELLLELGSVEADHLGRPELAIEAWRSAQTINAGDVRLFEALERLLVTHERWEELIDLLERRAALAEDQQQRIWILLNVAALARERLLDDGRAIEAYERIRGWAPAHVVATRTLEELYRAHGLWQPLAALLLDVAARTEQADTRVTALESAAQIYEEQLQDARAAFLVWLTVLRREPRRPGGLDALEHLGAVAAAWQELVPECEALAQELDSVDGETAAQLWRQVARWKRDHLGLQQEYGDGLKRSLRHAPADVDLLDELLELRRATGPWGELAAALSQRAALELDPVRRSELLAELGMVYETRLARPAEAVSAYEDAAAADPACKAALVGLRRIHQELAAWPALATVLERLLEMLEDGAAVAEKVAIHLELGAVLAEHLARPEAATRAFEAALALDPTNTRAFQGLAKVHQSTGQTDAYLATIEAELDAARSPSDAQRYAELASAWEERADQLDRAAACWQKLLTFDSHNEAAHLGLIRTLRKARRWPELAKAQRRYLETAFGISKRAEILLELAEDLESRQGDVDGAIGACHEVLALNVEPEPALEVLARCYARKNRWSEALETLERLLERAANDRARADLHQRIARIQVSRGDEAKALAGFEFALELDTSNAAAHEGIAQLYRQKSDWSKAADHLRHAGFARENRFESIRSLTEAAELYRNRLGDLARAGECLQRIVELDPDNLDAKHGLTELLAGTRQWEALWPHIEQLAETMAHDPDASPDQRRETYLRAARCALELGKSAPARELMDRAVAIDPANVAVLLERADALRRSEAWEPAVKAYQSILVQHAATLDASQRITAFGKLALIHQQLGRVPQTFAYYRKVLEIEPHHQETLQELAQLHLGRAEFDEAVASLRSLAETVAAEQRSPILEQIGDLYHDKLRNPARAAATYREALEHDGANRRILQKLLDVDSETGQWKAALDTIARFLNLETDARRRGKYSLAMAAIRRFKIKEEAAALDDYQRALDAFLDGSDALDEATRQSALEAFQNLDELLAARQEWQRQDRAHRLLIKRLDTSDPILVRLWSSLGEIQRTRLQQYESAIYAFETAHSLDPEKSPDRVRILAELYALVGKQQPTKVTDHAARLVDANPDDPEAYRAMGRACLEAGRVDETWCVSRALVYRKEATADEEEFYRRYQPHERRKAKGVLDDDAWAHLRDDDEDRIVSSIFALTWEGPVALRAGPAKSFQLKRKEKIKVEEGSRAIGKIFQNAARVLNAPLPHVYVQPERSGRLLLANCVEDGALVPTVIVARDLMTGFRDTEIAFSVASTLALLRPAWYLRLALPAVAELEAALTAAVSLVRENVTGRPELAPLVAAFSNAMQKRLDPQAAEVLRGFVDRLGERPNLARWRDAVDAAARRAGLLVCGELEAAARMVSIEPVLPDGPRARDKIRDLVVFSVSPGYFAARRKLGVAVA